MNRRSRDTKGRRRVLKALAAPPLVSLAAACEAVVPGKGPPPILYRLTPKSTFRADLPKVPWQLVLELPVTNAGLSTTRIALTAIRRAWNTTPGPAGPTGRPTWC
jgi:cholesterol transport system auxiliary component